MAEEYKMTKKQVVLAKEKIALLEKFGLLNSALNLNNRLDVSHDSKKALDKGYKIINVEDDTLNKRLCQPQVTGKREVVIGKESVGFLGRTKDITEWQEEKQVPTLESCPLKDWGGDIPLAVLRKINKAKKDGFKLFIVYSPQFNNQYSFSSCNDPIVVGYYSQGRYKSCTNPGVQCVSSKKDCDKEHWEYYQLGPAFEIAAWDQCDIDKGGI